VHLSFHGAAGTVTGSRHLLKAGGLNILVDAGLFQGLKKLRLKNWQKPTFESSDIDHLFLTHAHIDHSGYLPRLIKYGFKAPVHCTPATSELIELMLMDSAHIQEEDARYANKRGYSKHKPAEPLYDSEAALAALSLRKPSAYSKWITLNTDVRARFCNSGHILGAAFIEFRIKEDGQETVIVFSGDIGRYNVPLHIDPEPLPACDYLVIESTYGDRLHDYESVQDQIYKQFELAIHRRGVVLIPAFSVGRVQMVTLILRDLMLAGELPEVPIHIDRPMAIDATAIYSRHMYDCNLDDDIVQDGRSRLFPREVHLHRTVKESKELNTLEGPRVIIASSGMMTGGRIMHHLIRRLPHRDNLILLSGYQAVGTRGRALQDGAQELRMHGMDIPVRAKHSTIHGLSSHADYSEMLTWIKTAPQPPRKIFVVHGDEKVSPIFASRIESEIDSKTVVPQLEDGWQL